MLLASNGWIIAVGLFFLLIAVLAFSPIRLDGYLSRQGSNDEIGFRMRALYGLIRYQRCIPFMEFSGMSVMLKEQSAGDAPWLHASGNKEDEIDKDKIMSAIDKMQILLHVFRNLEGWMKKALGRVRLTEWRWTTSVGTGDAMWTAMATGAVWSVKSSIIGLLSQWVRLQKEPIMSVQPVYQDKAYFQTEWHCRARLTLWDAVVISLQLAARMKRTKLSLKQLQSLWKPSPAP